MDDEIHARGGGCIHNRFALMEHSDRVSCQHEQAINALQSRGKRSCVVEVEIDRFYAFPSPRFHVLLVSGRSHDLDVPRPLIESRSDCAAREAACAEH